MRKVFAIVTILFFACSVCASENYIQKSTSPLSLALVLDLRYLLRNQSTPQTTIGTFTFPVVNVGLGEGAVATPTPTFVQDNAYDNTGGASVNKWVMFNLPATWVAGTGMSLNDMDFFVGPGGNFIFHTGTTNINGTGASAAVQLNSLGIACALGNFDNIKLTAGGKIYPSADSTGSILFGNAATTTQLGLDTTNGRMFLGTAASTARFYNPQQAAGENVYTSKRFSDTSGGTGYFINFFNNDGTTSNFKVDTTGNMMINRLNIAGGGGTGGSLGYTYWISSGDITTTMNSTGYTFSQKVTSGGSINMFSLALKRDNANLAGYNALLVNVTEDAVGAANSNLLNLQRNSANAFTVKSNGNVYLLGGMKFYPSADSTTAINFANAAGTSFINFDTTGLNQTMVTTSKIQFRDVAIYIASLNDGYLDLEADTAIRLNADTNITGNLFLSTNYSVQFRDANQYVNSDDANYLDLHATTGIRLHQSIAVTGNVDASTYSVGTQAGIDYTLSYDDTVLGAKTLTFVKGILIASD